MNEVLTAIAYSTTEIYFTALAFYVLTDIVIRLIKKIV